MSVLARLWARRQRRPLLVAVVLVALGVFLVYPAVDWWLRGVGVASEFSFRDYGAYYNAIGRWQTGGPLYEQGENGGYHGTYLYPPVALLAFWPFVELFEFRTGALVWQTVSVAVLWLGLQTLVRALGYDLRWWERVGLLWVLAGYHPLVVGVKLGQTSAALTGLLCFVGAAVVTATPAGSDGGWRAHTSGVLTALVGTVKPAYAPVGAHLLSDRRRIGAAVATGLAALWLSIRLFGADTHYRYLDVLQWGVTGGASPRPPTLWLPPYYKPLSWLPGALALRLAAVVAVATLAVLAADRARRTVFALGVGTVPLLTPTTYTYYLTVLLPVGVVLLVEEIEGDGAPALVVVALTLANLHAFGLKLLADVLGEAIPFVTLPDALFFPLQPGLWGNLLLVGLAAYRTAQRVDHPATLLPERVRA